MFVRLDSDKKIVEIFNFSREEMEKRYSPGLVSQCIVLEKPILGMYYINGQMVENIPEE